MSLNNHFKLMANSNQRVNEQIYFAASSLILKDYERDTGAYFGSIQGTLNHILVGDLIWLSRFREHSENYKTLLHLDNFDQPKSLKDLLYRDFTSLRKYRNKLDLLIKSWVENDTEDADFTLNLEYTDTKGLSSSRNFGELMHHFFNHQTYHRGQVSTQLNQFGLDIGVTDFLIDIPSTA